MRVLNIDPDPIHYITYKVVAPRQREDRGQRIMQDTLFPILKGTVDILPEGSDALLLASDLQGHCVVNDEYKLIGEVMPEELKLLLEIEYPNILPTKTTVVLCGDLYAETHRRGGLGDVRDIWFTFREYFHRVIGVGGNHDMVGDNNSKISEFQREENIFYLENNTVKIDNLVFSGISGIIGSNRKINRIEETDFLKSLKKILLKKPDILLLHEGPDFPKSDFPGTSVIREVIEKSPPTLICCGHTHWEEPLREFDNGSQILNLEGRAILLTAVNE